MDSQKQEEHNIKKILHLFDKFSVSLMRLIKKLVNQKIVSLDAILVMLPKKNRDMVLKNFSNIKSEKKDRKRSR